MTETKVSAYNDTGQGLLLLALIMRAAIKARPAAKGSVVS